MAIPGPNPAPDNAAAAAPELPGHTLELRSDKLGGYCPEGPVDPAPIPGFPGEVAEGGNWC